MRQPWESGADSTVVAELHSVRPVQREWVEGMEGQWKELTQNDEIEEIAHLMVKCGTIPTKDAQINTRQGHMTHHSKELNSIVSKAITKAKQISPHQVSHVPQQYLHIWDSGGQPVFLDILPAFLTSRTMFLLLFDASKSLSERLPSLEYHDGKESKGEILKMSTIDLLCQWMASIYSHLARYDKKSKILSKCPRVSVVGTHRDKISENVEHKIREQLQEQFNDRAYETILESIVFVDNTKACKPESSGEDPNFQNIRSCVEEFTTNLKVKTPISWVLFRKVVQALRANIISLDEARAIGTQCNIPPHHIPSVLTFYHELGVVLYYPHIGGMEDKIIVNPRWLVDTIGKVFLQDASKHRIKHAVNTFKKKGILLQSLYEEAWSNSEGVEPETLMNILVSFRIAVHTSTLHRDYIDGIKQYFLPAVLPLSPESPPLSYSIRATPLHITFATQFVQPGFFSRLITTMASSSDYRVEFDHGVYRDRVTFSCGQHHNIDHVIMSDTPHAIQVDVCRVHGDEDGFSNVCQSLLKYLEECCSKVDQCLYDISKQQILNIAIGDDNTIPVSEAVSSQRKYQYLCNSEQCNDKDVHYLKEFTRGICTLSQTYRNLTRQENYWFLKVRPSTI